MSRGKQPQYFKSAFVGYTVGLVLTIVVMNWFQAAQVTVVWGCELPVEAHFFIIYLERYSPRKSGMNMTVESNGN